MFALEFELELPDFPADLPASIPPALASVAAERPVNTFGPTRHDDIAVPSIDVPEVDLHRVPPVFDLPAAPDSGKAAPRL